MNMAHINQWLSVGDLTSCRSDCIVVHVYREDFADRCNGGGSTGSITLNYKDGDPISDTMFVALDHLASTIIRSGKPKVLVHCHAGQTRSPVIASYLLALVEGIDIFDAAAIVGRALWKQRGLPINFTHAPLKSILFHVEHIAQ